MQKPNHNNLAAGTLAIIMLIICGLVAFGEVLYYNYAGSERLDPYDSEEHNPEKIQK